MEGLGVVQPDDINDGRNGARVTGVTIDQAQDVKSESADQIVLRGHEVVDETLSSLLKHEPFRDDMVPGRIYELRFQTDHAS